MKKKILIPILIIVLILLYFGYKGFNLLYYDVNNVTIFDYETFADNFKIKDTLTIEHKEIDPNDYLKYQNIKIKNDFRNFEKMDSTLDSSNISSERYILKNDKTTAFWMSVTDTYVYLLKSDKTLFGTEDKRITNSNLTDILNKYNIENDIDLFNFLSNKKNVKSNIFTSVKRMKENYAIYFMTSVMMPSIDSITLIDGDYNGYIFNMSNFNVKEVSIIKDNKRYTFLFINTEYFKDEYIKELLDTVVIE